MTTLELSARRPFDFHSVVNSHGWRQLAPFRFEADVLSYTDRLATGRVVDYHISACSVGVQVKTDKLSKAEQKEEEKRFENWGAYQGLAFWFWDWKYNGG